MKQYDYLIVGAGLFGATFAYLAKQAGKRCLVIDKRPHTGGNAYCEDVDGIHVHKYGAHIFHTKNKEVWDFVNSLVTFNRYTNSPHRQLQRTALQPAIQHEHLLSDVGCEDTTRGEGKD